MIQMGLLTIGIGVCLRVGLDRVGGWHTVIAEVDPARLTAVDFSDWGVGAHGGFGFWPMRVGGLFLYVSYYGADQSQAPRLLSARDPATGRYWPMGCCVFRSPCATA